MGYVVRKRDRWYAVGYEGIDPVTGRDRRRWHPAADEVSARVIAESLPAARGGAAHGMTLARFMRTRWLPARQDRLRPTTTGMRRGEVLGLRWSDIDLDARRLSLQRSVTCTGYKVHTTPTKTRTSRRPIDLDATTVGVLADWRAAQARELGSDVRARVVFTRQNGEPIHPHVLSQTFERC